jgi:hypothetical protein
LPLLFNFALEYAFRKVQVGLKLNRTHLLLVYADDVNLLGDKCSKEQKVLGTTNCLLPLIRQTA